MTRQFKIWHLLVLTAIVAVSVYFAVPQETFPFETVGCGSRANWRLEETLGDAEGPFKSVGVFSFNPSVSPRRAIRYQTDSGVEKFIVPAYLDGFELLVESYENPKRNSLVLLYKRVLN